MNLVEIIYQARSDFAEPLADFVEDVNEVIPWINEGLRMWVITTKSNRVLFPAIPTVASQRAYAYPAGCLMVNHVVYAGKKLIPADFENVMSITDWGTLEGTVTNYYNERDGYISLLKVPADAGVSLEIYGTKRPVALVNNADIPTEVPEDYHHALALYAAHKNKMKDEEGSSANEFYKQFMDLAKRYYLQLHGTPPNRKRMRNMLEFRVDKTTYESRLY